MWQYILGLYVVLSALYSDLTTVKSRKLLDEPWLEISARVSQVFLATIGEFKVGLGTAKHDCASDSVRRRRFYTIALENDRLFLEWNFEGKALRVLF